MSEGVVCEHRQLSKVLFIINNISNVIGFDSKDVAREFRIFETIRKTFFFLCWFLFVMSSDI